MKKLLIGLFVTSLMFSCDSGTAETTEKSVKECDANDVASAAKCVCELFETEDALLLEGDSEELKIAEEKTNKFNKEIDKAIADGKYTEDDLVDAANEIGCNL